MLEGRELVILLYLKYSGNWNDMYKAIKDKEKLSEDEIYKLSIGVNFNNYITVIDSDYPSEFLSASKPPMVLHKYDLDAYRMLYNKYEHLFRILGDFEECD